MNQAPLQRNDSTGLESIRDSLGLQSKQSIGSRVDMEPDDLEREQEIISLEVQKKRIDAQISSLAIGSGSRSASFVTIKYARAGIKETIPIVLPTRELARPVSWLIREIQKKEGTRNPLTIYNSNGRPINPQVALKAELRA